MKNYLPLISVFLLSVLLLGAGCIPGASEDQQMDEDEIMNIVEEVDGDGKVRGSCSVIDQNTCLDYIGSIWTKQQMELNCQGSGVFSLETCPYSTVGGCRTGEGTISETIVWSYLSQEEASYQAKACNALPVASWVMPDDVFLK
jgi:hypothetical protein